MPTYEYRCEASGRVAEAFQSLAQHELHPTPLDCHERPMARFFGHVGPLLDALANDRHYQDLRATDGTDISSRAKHRAYMKAHDLTTIDDFTETWARAAQARAECRDPERRADVERAIARLEK